MWIKAQHKTDFEFFETAPEALRKTMQNNVSAVFSSIHDSYFSKKAGLDLSTNYATRNAIDQLQAIWSSSRFYCTEIEVIRRVLQTTNGFQIRNIPVFFEQGGTDEDKYLDLVIELTSDGKISDVTVALPMHLMNGILDTRDMVTDLRRRQMILRFLENFLTAYYRKDMNFLDRIFSDDVIDWEMKSKSDLKSPKQGMKEYVIIEKNQYMNSLKSAFIRNEFVNIKFSEIEVIQLADNKNIYGITLLKHWNSANYKESVWFFMMVDFRDENNPIIWVRTWQPLEVQINQRFGFDYFPLL